jgi:hypothetical protein
VDTYLKDKVCVKSEMLLDSDLLFAMVGDDLDEEIAEHHWHIRKISTNLVSLFKYKSKK